MAFRTLTFVVMIAGAAAIAKGQAYSTANIYPLLLPPGYYGAFPTSGSQASAGGQVVGSGTSGNDHAFLWSSSGTGIDLSTNLSSSVVKSYAVATNGSHQVGYSEASGGPESDRALVWSGSGSSVVDLNPDGMFGATFSEALGTGGTQQVGYATGSQIGNLNHAFLWTGSSGSAIDLNPASLSVNISNAVGSDGAQEVGYGKTSQLGSEFHALMWSGSAASAVDLNPSTLGISQSYAFGAGGNQQVGEGLGDGTSTDFHALLWAGNSPSAVDLNPPASLGIRKSEARGTNGTQQVGSGSGSGTGNQLNALAWSGTASSVVNLQPLLPSAGNWISSYANTIDNSGNIFGVANGTYNGITGFFAVEWAPAQGSNLIDIRKGSLNIANSSLSIVTNQIRQGYNGGNWAGTTGITSSAAAADPAHLTAVGVLQDLQSGNVRVKYTYYGDVNLDGTVDGSDYSRIDSAILANRSTPGSATGWYNGDFNYDGVIDGSDYTLIDNAFNTQGVSLSNEVASVTTETVGAANQSSVPEPASSLWITIALLPGRRRRQR